MMHTKKTCPANHLRVPQSEQSSDTFYFMLFDKEHLQVYNNWITMTCKCTVWRWSSPYFASVFLYMHNSLVCAYLPHLLLSLPPGLVPLEPARMGSQKMHSRNWSNSSTNNMHKTFQAMIIYKEATPVYTTMIIASTGASPSIFNVN